MTNTDAMPPTAATPESLTATTDRETGSGTLGFPNERRKRNIPVATAAERVRHIVDCAFAGRRIVIFSGGAAVFDDDKLLDEIRAIRAGGGFGSIIGRNSFQRPKQEALRMLGAVMDIYAAAPDRDGTH